MTKTTLLSKTLLEGRQDFIPIWFMRQAGRYLPEYQKLKKKEKDFIHFCRNVDLSTEATLQPLKRFHLDAAIIFSDILVIPNILGQNVHFTSGLGVALSPIDWKKIDYISSKILHSSTKDIEDFLKNTLGYVYKICSNVRRNVQDKIEIIGFAGAPWTLLCYMLEGKSSPNFTKSVIQSLQESEKIDKIIDTLTTLVAHHLILQSKNGAGVVQVFDSLSHVLPPKFFQRWCVKPLAKIVQIMRSENIDVPVIAFPRCSGFSLENFCQETNINGLSLPEWACLSEIKKDMNSLKKNIALQGNLHPSLLVSGGKALFNDVKSIIKILKDFPHIFNLGHGVLPSTDYNNIQRVIDCVREHE